MPKQRVLVTGASGLVGKAICAAVSADDDIVLVPATSRDADLRDYGAVCALLAAHAPLDGIIHLAANVGGLFKNMAKPVEMLEDNLLMNTNLLRAAHAAGINRVLCYLSTCIFPNWTTYPIPATALHNGPPHSSNEAYAHAKRMMEVQCRAYQQQHGREYFCVVPTNIYGPHDNFHLADAHIIPALIHKCWLSQKNNTPFEVAGDGTPLRQFIYSDDIARLTLWAYRSYTDIAKPLILCPPDSEVPIAIVVAHIVREMGYKGRVIYDTTKPNGQYKKTADCAQLAQWAHGVRFTVLAEGIARTVEWFRAAIEAGTARIT